MSIKIIGAGFPRTGTSSLKVGLEMLGFDECYHMKNLLINPYKLPYWNELETKGTTNYEELFEGFQAIVDIPGYLYYQTLMDQYPNAKVILSTRDFDGWYDSINSTLVKAVYPNFDFKLMILRNAIFRPVVFKSKKCVDMVKRTFFENQFEGNFSDKARAKELYYRHHETVKQTVPEDKLLIYKPGDGWEPLCTFLNVPVPEQEYPHLNKKENFRDMMGHLLAGQMV